MLRRFLLVLLLIVAAIILILLMRSEPELARPIVGERSSAPAFIGTTAVARPFDFTVPSHPYMAPQGKNTMHSDSYSSDVHASGGPLGRNVQKASRVGITTAPGGQCATLTIAENQNLVVLCASMIGFRIHLIEHRSLKLLAEYKLPMRPSYYDALIHRDKSYIMKDTSGSYFYLDDQDRIVMATSDQSIRRLAHQQKADGSWEFVLQDQWDLSSDVPHDCTTPLNWNPGGECDPIIAVMPDHNGLIWWVTRNARYGTLNTTTGEVIGEQLDDEEIQNGFSVAQDGVYIISDHAMYRFHASDNGKPNVLWREAYDRGKTLKVGAINQGSGTTPTLIGERYVTIADNADGRINLLVYLRQHDFKNSRLICKTPMFTEGHSVTENSMVAFGRSIIVENNAGYTSSYDQRDWSNAGGGIMRIDIRADESGCDVVWHSMERSTSVVPKLSAANGLVYFYTYEQQIDGKIAWYLTALDHETGNTQFKILTGVGREFDNNWSPISLAPDGTAYIGVSKGLIAIWDTE